MTRYRDPRTVFFLLSCFLLDANYLCPLRIFDKQMAKNWHILAYKIHQCNLFSLAINSGSILSYGICQSNVCSVINYTNPGSLGVNESTILLNFARFVHNLLVRYRYPVPVPYEYRSSLFNVLINLVTCAGFSSYLRYRTSKVPYHGTGTYPTHN
jgi:hypothetical protein